MPDSRYLHGTTPREQRRLSLLNDLLNGQSLRELGLARGDRVLEMGSGLGQFALAMARQVGSRGRVLGIERSREQLSAAVGLVKGEKESGWIEFREGDALEPPLTEAERETFDVAHARFLLEHVPDPQAVVREMVRAVRPGGRVVLEDDDHDVLRLWPEPPGFAPLWSAYTRAYDRLGNDPYVGRRLASLLQEAGAIPSRISCLFYGSCSGGPNLEGVLENLIRLLQGARTPVVSAGLLDGGHFDGALEALRIWGRRGDAALWYSIPWAEGIRPSAARYSRPRSRRRLRKVG